MRKKINYVIIVFQKVSAQEVAEMQGKPKILKCIAVLLALCCLFASCSAVTTRSLTAGAEIQAQNAGSSYHMLSGKSASLIKTKFIELLFDEKTYAVSVKDHTGDCEWTSLPTDSNDAAYAFAATLYTKNGIYHLNTQDNSVAFGAASYEKTEDTLTVRYVLSDKKETAGKKYEEINADDVYVSFAVTYGISAQSMTLGIDAGNILCTPGSFVGELSVLPYFGSASPADGDYMFVPDGCGAVMRTDADDVFTADVNIKVYGQDPVFGDETDSAHATVPVYGVKHSGSAFAAIITDGDALAEINASRADKENPPSVGAQFRITQTCKNANSSKINYGVSYDGKITVKYKFLSGTSATYIGMASAAREEFIAQGWISSSKHAEMDTLPFYLTMDGAENGSVLTTTHQAIDILSTLKGKGVNDVVFRYKGIFSGGITQKNLYRSSVSRDLGGLAGMISLYEYAQRQNYSLLIDINMATSGKTYAGGNAASLLGGGDSYYFMRNSLGFRENTNNRLLTRIGATASNEGKAKSNPSIYSSDSKYKMYLMNINRLPNRFSSFLEDELSQYTNGYSVNDLGFLLYSGNGVNRQRAKEIAANEIRTIPNYGSLSVSGGNIYAVYNAEYVTDMAFDTYYPESSLYEPVPFTQAVLHGYSLYNGEPIDASDPLYKYDMLQYIEYGAVPAFEWVFNERSIFCYNGYIVSDGISDVINFYNDAADMLSDLADDTITDHRKVTRGANGESITGVYCTTYSDGTEIYVNYTGSVVTMPNNVIVGPHDYVRVNY